MAKPDTKTQKPESKKGASVKLEGKTQTDFDIVKSHIEKTIPGINTTNTDVMCHALHLAAASIVPKQKEPQKPTKE